MTRRGWARCSEGSGGERNRTGTPWRFLLSGPTSCALWQVTSKRASSYCKWRKAEWMLSRSLRWLRTLRRNSPPLRFDGSPLMRRCAHRSSSPQWSSHLVPCLLVDSRLCSLVGSTILMVQSRSPDTTGCAILSSRLALRVSVKSPTRGNTEGSGWSMLWITLGMTASTESLLRNAMHCVVSIVRATSRQPRSSASSTAQCYT